MSVESLKGRKYDLGCSLELASDDYVYIGRQMNMGGWKLSKSMWANPYSVKEFGRDKALRKYKKYILNNKTLFKSLDKLKGKILLCWCKPEKCHGDILIELIKNDTAEKKRIIIEQKTF